MMEACFFYIIKDHLFYVVETTKNKKSRYNFRYSNKLIYVDRSWQMVRYNCMLDQGNELRFRPLKPQMNQLNS